MRNGHRARVVVALSALAGTLVVVGGASPAAGAACSIEQLTDESAGEVFSPDINPAGNRIAFTSTEDLTGGNPTNQSRVFRWNGDSTFTQLTNGEAFQPSINAAGDRIAFTSLDANGGVNPEGNQDVFQWIESPTPHIVQLSLTPPGTGMGSPQSNAAGDRVAFSGNQDGGNSEVWLWVDDGTPAATPQTVTTAPVINNATGIDDAGTHIAYSSGRDLGANPDGNDEIFVHSTIGGGSDIQVTTSTGGANSVPDINAGGTRVVFHSDRNYGGGNADGSGEVFVANASGVGTPTRLTGNAFVNAFRGSVPHVDAAGDRVVFYDSGNLTGENPDLSREVFARDVGGTGRLSAVTASSGVSQVPVVNGDGTRIAFASSADLVGQNSDGNAELFLASCGAPAALFTDVPTSNAFFDQVQWMVERGIAGGFPNHTFKPLDAVKRQQMANFLYNLAGQPAFTPPVTPTFSDVPTSNPFYEQIEWMVDQGIAGGFPNHTFKPLDAVKRQQMANFVFNFTQCCEIPL
jgi:Tol biopolymer transport system component